MNEEKETSEVPSWEERFDKLRKEKWHYADVGNEHTKEIKDFIRQTIISERKSAVEEVLAEVESKSFTDENYVGFIIIGNQTFNEIKKKYDKT